MDIPAPHITALFDQASAYEESGDAYNAIKLYKKVARLAPQWAPPLQRLGLIYKYRLEWKPAMHYVKKSLAIDPGNESAWWDLGIAATAQKKWRLARNVWSKFGRNTKAGWVPGPVSVRLSYQKQFEILWASTIDPARAIVQNIPHPDSNRHYKDVILYDRGISGYHVVHQKRFPIREELGLYKSSGYNTFSCLLETVRPGDVKILEQLCRDADLGFEVWSNAVRQFNAIESRATPEYYDPGMFEEDPGETVHVAIAARREKHVKKVLRSWQVICLGQYSNLQCHL